MRRLLPIYCWWQHWCPRQCELFSGARSWTITNCFKIWFLVSTIDQKSIFTDVWRLESTFKASVERVGHVYWTNSQNCVNFLLLKHSESHIWYALIFTSLIFFVFKFPFLMMFYFYIIEQKSLLKIGSWHTVWEMLGCCLGLNSFKLSTNIIPDIHVKF